MVIMGNSNYWILRFSDVFIYMMMILLLEPKKSLVNAGRNDATTILVPNFCTTNSNVLLPPYHDIPKSICSTLDWHGYSISFYQDNNAVVTVVLTGIHENNWISVGVSRDGMMVGSSAVVGWMNNDGKSGTVKQYFLSGRMTSEEGIPDRGDLKFTNVTPTIVLKDKMIYMGFQLQFPQRLNRQPFLFACGFGKPAENNILPKHKYRSSLAVDFSRGAIYLGFVDSTSVKLTHGILAITGWGIIIPFGVPIARHFRQYEPLWYYLHSSIQFVGFFVGLAAVAVGRTLYDLIHADFNYHRVLGFTILALSVLQICQFIVRPSSSSKTQDYWNKIHHWVGRLVIVLAPVNIFLGLYKGNGARGLMITFLCFFFTFLFISIYLEIRLLLQKKRDPNTKLTEPPLFQVPPRNS
ncbi:cytochrome b561 and DOMON domain-containing protein At3g61750-like [Prunus avium]|uniref:Cytochrome b561 and DOMON domain-containing protein At3g61750-like n=2 Tax=Prunus avium TaxID=42229 RepID=A0A6P5TQY0_PRUAV|nr:cytochrome b561 and DOMON domain-containing protein At3g61750-like [Prunus avium]